MLNAQASWHTKAGDEVFTLLKSSDNGLFSHEAEMRFKDIGPNEIKEGDAVDEGDLVLILQTMKMENPITTPVSGTVQSITFKNGGTVQKGDVLAVIG